MQAVPSWDLCLLERKELDLTQQQLTPKAFRTHIKHIIEIDLRQVKLMDIDEAADSNRNLDSFVITNSAITLASQSLADDF